MKQQAGKFYVYAVPLLLFSFRMAVFICAKDAAKENATITLSSPATAHTVVLPLVMTTPETWHPFVAQIPAKEKAKEGETVALNCQFHSPWGPSLSKLTVKWYKEDEKGQSDLLENNVTVLTNYSRAFIHGNLAQGDASLTILNVTASDHGIYFCQVTLSSGKVVMGSGTKLRIRRALGLFGIEESIGTIIGVVAAGVGGLVVLIIVLTPRLRKCLLCIKQAPHQDNPTLDVTACMDIAHHSPTKNLEESPCPQTPTQRDTLNRHRPFRNTDLSLNSSPAPFSLNHCSYPHHLRPYMDFLPVAAKDHRSTEGQIFKAAPSRLLGVKRSARFFKSA